MKSLTITSEGYDGIPAVADALTEDDLKLWADTKDPSLIPHAIAMLKAAGAAASETTGGDDTTGGETTGGDDTPGGETPGGGTEGGAD